MALSRPASWVPSSSSSGTHSSRGLQPHRTAWQLSEVDLRPPDASDLDWQWLWRKEETASAPSARAPPRRLREKSPDPTRKPRHPREPDSGYASCAGPHESGRGAQLAHVRDRVMASPRPTLHQQLSTQHPTSERRLEQPCGTSQATPRYRRRHSTSPDRQLDSPPGEQDQMMRRSARRHSSRNAVSTSRRSRSTSPEPSMTTSITMSAERRAHSPCQHRCAASPHRVRRRLRSKSPDPQRYSRSPRASGIVEPPQHPRGLMGSPNSWQRRVMAMSPEVDRFASASDGRLPRASTSHRRRSIRSPRRVRRRFTSKSPDPERRVLPRRDRGSPRSETPLQPVVVSILDDSPPRGSQGARKEPPVDPQCSPPRAMSPLRGPRHQPVREEPVVAPSSPPQAMSPLCRPLHQAVRAEPAVPPSSPPQATSPLRGPRHQPVREEPVDPPSSPTQAMPPLRGPRHQPVRAQSSLAQDLSHWAGPGEFWEQAANRWRAYMVACSTSGGELQRPVVDGTGSADDSAAPGPVALKREARGGQPCRVDDIVAMLGGCKASTMQRIAEARSLTGCIKLLQECLLGGKQHRREELWEALRDTDQMDFQRLLSADRRNREDGILALLQGTSLGSIS